MYFCKLTNREFEGKQGFINHLRSNYKDMEEAYIYENNIIPKRCIYCNDTAKFLGFFKGYHYRCEKKECIEKSEKDKWNKVLKRMEKRKESNLNYYNFVLKNFYFYNKNKNLKNIIDPYFNKNIGNITLKDFVSRNIPQDKKIKTVKCKFCGKNIERKLFDLRNWCYHCRQTRNKGYQSKFPILYNAKEANNFYHTCLLLEEDPKIAYNETRNRCLNVEVFKYIIKTKKVPLNYWICPVTKWMIPLNQKTNTLIKFLKYKNINIEEYYNLYLKDYIFYCKNCNTLINYSKDLININDSKFCNHNCYWEYKIKHPEEYKASEKQKELNSICMKKNIANGKINPARNHWNGENIEWNGYSYRSSWEAVFHHFNKHLYYEKIRIKYFSSEEQKERIYIVDFVDFKNRILYEIKPKVHKNDIISIDKHNAALKWCENNNYTFKIIDEDYFKRIINEDTIKLFSNKIQKKMEQFIYDKN